MSKFYPTIEITWVQNVSMAIRLLKLDPDWLSESPYSSQIEDILLELAGSAPQVETSDDTEDIDLLHEVQKLYRDLNNTPRGTGKDAMAFYRTASTILGRLMEQVAKAEEIKQYKEFKERVFAMFEHVLTADQITDAMAYLKGTGGEISDVQSNPDPAS